MQIERSEPLDSHFEECADCRRAREVYDRLKQTLANLDEDQLPSVDWQQRVVDHCEPRGAKRRGWWFGGVAVAASLTLAVWTLSTWGPADGTLDLQLIDSGTVYRGTTAKPGDSLTLNAVAKRADYTELRVYLDGSRLLFACDTAPPCRRDGSETTALATLSALGTYHAVLIVSREPIPSPSGNLDTDALAAREAGAKVVIGQPVDVR